LPMIYSVVARAGARAGRWVSEAISACPRSCLCLSTITREAIVACPQPPFFACPRSPTITIRGHPHGHPGPAFAACPQLPSVTQDQPSLPVHNYPSRPVFVSMQCPEGGTWCPFGADQVFLMQMLLMVMSTCQLDPEPKMAPTNGGSPSDSWVMRAVVSNWGPERSLDWRSPGSPRSSGGLISGVAA